MVEALAWVRGADPAGLPICEADAAQIRRAVVLPCPAPAAICGQEDVAATIDCPAGVGIDEPDVVDATGGGDSGRVGRPPLEAGWESVHVLFSMVRWHGGRITEDTSPPAIELAAKRGDITMLKDAVAVSAEARAAEPEEVVFETPC